MVYVYVASSREELMAMSVKNFIALGALSLKLQMEDLSSGDSVSLLDMASYDGFILARHLFGLKMLFEGLSHKPESLEAYLDRVGPHSGIYDIFQFLENLDGYQQDNNKAFELLESLSDEQPLADAVKVWIKQTQALLQKTTVDLDGAFMDRNICFDSHYDLDEVIKVSRRADVEHLWLQHYKRWLDEVRQPMCDAAVG